MARSAPIARPAMSLPSHTVSGDQSAGGILEDVAEVHDPAARVGDLDADRLLARDRREDPDIGGGQRVGEVVLELGDLGDLGPGREAQLVAGDVRPGDAADDLRLDAEVAERLEQRPAPPAPARRCRAWPPRRSSGSGNARPARCHSKSGSSVIERPVATLGREVARVRGAATGVGLARELVSASGRASGHDLGLARRPERRGLVPASSSARRSAAPRRGWRARRARRCPARGQQRLERLGFERSVAHRPSGAPAAAVRRGRSGDRAARSSVERFRRAVACRRDRRPVAPDHRTAERRAGDEDQTGDEQEHGQDVARRASRAGAR